MIVSSCPLRISLVGGSTDHPEFLKKFGEGSVISFPCNLRVYATVHRDVAGFNAVKKKFIINYTQREEVDHVDDIKNDVVREVLKWFKIDRPLTISLTSDISSSGSGLASSSAYIMALVNAMYKLDNKDVTEFEVATVAFHIEQKFNPLVGQQDFYGSLSGGIKRINFFAKKPPSIEYIPCPMWLDSKTLIHTGVTRQSTNVLSTIDVNKCLPLLDDVERLYEAFLMQDVNKVFDVINRSWANKKETSNIICENPKVAELDKILNENKYIKAHKLCGAGNGGYFLTFGTIIAFQRYWEQVSIPITISNEGLKITQI